MFTDQKFNLLEEIQDVIALEIKNQQLEAIEFILEKPKRIVFGDISTNFLMILKSKKIPEEQIQILLQKVETKLKAMEAIGEINVMGGFLNIKIAPSYYEKILLSLEEREGEKMLRANCHTREKIQATPSLHFEFGSINPNGPVHLGHIRTITVASCLYNLLSAMGFNIYREFFLNDCGNQIENFLTSIYYRWQEREGIEVPEIPYKGEYVKELIPQELPQDITLQRFIKDYKEPIIENVKKNILSTLQSYGVIYDRVTAESDLHKDSGLILKVINNLISKGLIAFVEDNSAADGIIDLSMDYDAYCHNITEIPKEKRVILLSKKMDFEKNKVLIRSNGALTYFAADILYLFDKVQRGFNNQYCFLGEDHIGHLNMLSPLAKLIFPQVSFTVKKVGFVKVLDHNHQIIPMSKRSGQFLSIAEAEEKIGRDFLKMIMISRCMNGELVFSMGECNEEDLKKNCLFYIQYCCTRIASVLRKATNINKNAINTNGNNPWYLNIMQEERNIFRHLLWFDTLMNQGAINEDINEVYQYIYDLASYFHEYFTAGTRDVGMRFITQDDDVTAYRLRILTVIQKIIHYILERILDIQPLKAM